MNQTLQTKEEKSMEFIPFGGESKDLARFGRLLVKADFGKICVCLCDCGSILAIRRCKLTTGHTKSCGCLRRDVAAKSKFQHGFAKAGHRAKIYERWKGMIARCYNANHKSFKNYGGRGISVCRRWLNSFTDFLADMGMPPSGLLLDRIDNDGNYGPENCRWTDYKTSANNRRKRKANQ